MRCSMAVLLVLALGACGSEESDRRPDGGGTTYPDVWGTSDVPIWPVQEGGPPPCQLGLPNSCGTCTDVCPGNDDDRSERICANRTCGVACKADHYDVDGQAANGCEVTDDLPLHATAETAKQLGEVDDCDGSGGTENAVLPSDGRKHLAPPEDRSQGVPDFYSVTMNDTWSCQLDPYVRVDAAAMPASVTLEVKLTYTCAAGGGPFSETFTVSGGSSAETTMSVDCDTGSESGTLLIEVRKTNGDTHTKEQYTLIYHG